MLTQILLHTPSWVWLVLALALWRGYALTKPQRVGQWRIAILPSLFATLSLAGVVSSFGAQADALLCWGCGMALSAFATQRQGAAKGALYRPDTRSYELPGSRVPLLLVVLIFLVKYGVGVQLALHPAAARRRAVRGGGQRGLWSAQRRVPGARPVPVATAAHACRAGARRELSGCAQPFQAVPNRRAKLPPRSLRMRSVEWPRLDSRSAMRAKRSALLRLGRKV